ncbi:hypothetical protein cyc_06041 [Cyclospora cayetanensis]|uniref:Calcineurin-like phosphoesterase domain-containing protein n=1 Tax=Cyclospora cayetanensis TaxID=88456 RepID=A0A1D3D7D9_9EIME|nr:hypothetical protein cyc_06041 [Cyclospora cayetanensis]
MWKAVTGTAAEVRENFSNDVLILAGDVHYEMDGLKESLQLFSSVFGHVAFVPGNHELWVTQKDRESGITDSLRKFDSILHLCDSLGVHTRPFTPISGVRLVPLFSWYDEFDPSFRRVALPSPKPGSTLRTAANDIAEVPLPAAASTESGRMYDHKLLLSLSENWMDYSACKWPHPLSNNDPGSEGGRSTPYSSQQCNEAEHILSSQSSARNNSSSCCSCMGESTSCSSPPSTNVSTSTAASRQESSAVSFGSRESHEAFSEAPHYGWSVEKARTVRPMLFSSSSPRRTTDTWGMPLSLAEFFASENERRGCFAPEALSESTRQSHSVQSGRSPAAGPASAATDVPPSAAAEAATNHNGGAKQEDQTHCSENDRVSSSAAAGLTCATVVECAYKPAPTDFDKAPVVITFSHFLPRAELATVYPLKPRALAYVMGSSRIDEQLRQAGGTVHVFGHSHVDIDQEIEGVRYIQHALGRPSEQKWFPGRRKPKVICEVAN